MKQSQYPNHTAVSVQISMLFKATEKRTTPERVSSRMVKCASVMDPSEFVGWQMFVPTKGIVKMQVYQYGILHSPKKI